MKDLTLLHKNRSFQGKSMSIIFLSFLLYFLSFSSAESTVSADIVSVTYDKTSVVRGKDTITATITIRNTGDIEWTFYITGSTIKDGGTTWYDFTPTRISKTLSPGATGTVSVSWSPSDDVDTGNYGFYCKVFKYSSGSEYVDEYWEDSAFKVVEPSVSADIVSVTYDKTSVVRGKDTITATITIRNTGDIEWTFYITGSTIKDGGTTWYDFTPTRISKTLSPGATGTVSVSWSPSDDVDTGNYGFYCKVFKYSSGSEYVDEYWEDSAFKVVEPSVSADIVSVTYDKTSVVRGKDTITATITIRNTGDIEWTFYITGSTIKDGGTTWYDFTPTRISKTLSPGATGTVSVSWSPSDDVDTGNYGFYCKVFKYSSGSEYVDEYWEDSAFKVVEPSVSADIVSVTYDKTSVVRGKDTITATITIRNTGDIEWTFYITGSTIKDGGTTWYDFTPTRISKTLSPGATGTVSVSWSPSDDVDTGNYGFYCKVFKYSSGSEYVDEYWEDSAFKVVEPLNLIGRICYHSYSGYLNEPINSEDGHIFLFDLQTKTCRNLTKGLNVKNAMNPCFSPDGMSITFMAIPQDSPVERDSLEIYVFDFTTEELRRLTYNNIPDEDPKFSPDGSHIVFKREGEIWLMKKDGKDCVPITSGGGEKSGPNFSPSGGKIVYWLGTDENAGIWWMNSNGTGEEVLVDEPQIQEYYPIFKSNEEILYTRWESIEDKHDKVFIYSILEGVYKRLPINMNGVDDSDPFPINNELIGFSSTRPGGKGGYDIYLGNIFTGEVYHLDGMNDSLDNLGGCYSPVIPGKVTGNLTYTGSLSGDIYIEFCENSEFTSSLLYKRKLREPGNYWINLPPGNYYVFAFIDQNGDGVYEEGEPAGIYTNNPIEVTERKTTENIDIAISDDSDFDGLPDWWENQYFGTLTYGTGDDPDNDGLTNLEEYNLSTNPTNPDTDGDGLPDGWEVQYGLDPNDSTGDNGADGDPDNDGYTNLQEYQGGSNPTDGNDIPAQIIPLHPGWNLISFSVNNCYYDSDNPPDIPLLPGVNLIPVDDLGDIFVDENGNSFVDRIIAVRGFDRYGAHTYVPGSPYSTLHYMASGYGYWIKISEGEDIKWKVEGARANPTDTLQLQEGWNLVGFWDSYTCYYDSENPPDVDLPPDVTNFTQVDDIGNIPIINPADSIIVIRSFDEKGAHTYVPDSPYSTLHYIAPGYGYWIKVTEESTLSWQGGEK